MIRQDSFTPGVGERILLQIQLLIIGKDTCVAD